jgi:hypothetical protein
VDPLSHKVRGPCPPTLPLLSKGYTHPNPSLSKLDVVLSYLESTQIGNIVVDLWREDVTHVTNANNISSLKKGIRCEDVEVRASLSPNERFPTRNFSLGLMMMKRFGSVKFGATGRADKLRISVRGRTHVLVVSHNR